MGGRCQVTKGHVLTAVSSFQFRVGDAAGKKSERNRGFTRITRIGIKSETFLLVIPRPPRRAWDLLLLATGDWRFLACHPERGRAKRARVRVEGPAVWFVITIPHPSVD